MKPNCKVLVDTPFLFKVRGSDYECEGGKWDFAYCYVTPRGYILINAAAGAVLDREHALLFAERLRTMALAMPDKEVEVVPCPHCERDMDPARGCDCRKAKDCTVATCPCKMATT